MNRLIFYLAAALVGCIGPFAGKKVSPWLADPPVLKATFSSEEAAAHLVWHPVPSSGFLYGEIQRAAGGEFAAIARVESAADTAYTDVGLLANAQYSYRIVSFYGEGETVHELVSTDGRRQVPPPRRKLGTSRGYDPDAAGHQPQRHGLCRRRGQGARRAL